MKLADPDHLVFAAATLAQGIDWIADLTGAVKYGFPDLRMGLQETHQGRQPAGRNYRVHVEQRADLPDLAGIVAGDDEPWPGGTRFSAGANGISNGTARGRIRGDRPRCC